MTWSDIWALWEARRYSRIAWDAPQTSMEPDRRIFRRIALQVPCRLEHSVFGQQTEGATLDMSLGGLGIVAPVSWPEGSHVQVQFETFRWSVAGVLIFRRQASSTPDGQWRYGLKFLSLKMKDLLRVRHILREYYRGSLTVT